MASQTSANGATLRLVVGKASKPVDPFERQASATNCETCLALVPLRRVRMED